MAGATISVTNVVPHQGKLLVYFSVTLDGSAKADFSGYSGVDWVNAVDVTTLAPEAATAYAAAGDITFTNASNVIKGVALVTL